MMCTIRRLPIARTRHPLGMKRPATVLLLLGALVFCLGFAAPQAQETLEPAGEVQGYSPTVGTQFVATGDDFTLSVQTSDPVEALLRATAADALDLDTRPLDGLTSTEVRISGLPPDMTLYKYVNRLSAPEALQTTLDGSLTFTLDLSTPSLLMIRPQTATVYLEVLANGDAYWSPSWAGDWNPSTRVATLLTDISTALAIDCYTTAGVTFDGNGHTVDSRSDFYYNGIYVHGPNVTVQNVTVKSPQDGVYAYNVSGLTVQNVTVEATGAGWTGIAVGVSSNLRIRNNILASAYHGMWFWHDTDLQVTGNVFPGVTDMGIYTWMCTDVEILENEVATCAGGIFLDYATRGRVVDNVISATLPWVGIYARWANDFVISNNQSTGELALMSSSNNEIFRNSFYDEYNAVKLYTYYQEPYNDSRWGSHNNVIYENDIESYRSWPLAMWDPYGVNPLCDGNLVYNNNLHSEIVDAGIYAYGGPENRFYLPPLYGGNYYGNAYDGVDADGDGFGDTPYYCGGGSFTDEYPRMVPGQWPVTVCGVVSSDCEGPLGGLEVTVTQPLETYTTTTAEDGSYSLLVRYSEFPGTVSVTAPLGYHPVGDLVTSFTDDVLHNFVLDCIYVTVSGTIFSDCGGPMPNVPIALEHPITGYMPALTGGDGSYSFVARYSAQPGQLMIPVPVGYELVDPLTPVVAVDLTDDATQHFQLACPFVTVSGFVTSDCDEAGLADVQVTLTHPEQQDPFVTTTVADGAYSFDNIPRANDPGTLSIAVPAGYTAADPSPASVEVSLSDDVAQDFTLTCIYVTVSGRVVSDCQDGLIVAVDLAYRGEVLMTQTAEDGSYIFGDERPLRYTEELGEVSIVTPLGYVAVDPSPAHTAVDFTDDTVQDFTLECLAATGEARSMGYWKHQARVHLYGRGNAQETLEDMEEHFPSAIFSHFYDSELGSIAVEGVTYMTSGGADVPIDLPTIESTLTVRGGGTMLERAKQHYLALLLNIASGKLLNHVEISEDPFTVSQAIQEVADLINNGTGDADYEKAKDISEAINHSILLPAEVIRDHWENIAYRDPSLREDVVYAYGLAQNAPNPFKPTTAIAFTLPTADQYRLAIFDASGRLVRRFEGQGAAGPNAIVWDGASQSGAGVASGVYFYTLNSGSFRETRRMIRTN